MPTPPRIDQTFSRLKEEGKSAFVAYVTAGDPDPEATLDVVLALVRAGSDIIELGLPFSDPLADGVVNQLAAQRALATGMNTAKLIDLIRRIREKSEIPLVVFTYLNPVYAYGYERFHADAAAAGADGILTLDLPPAEESQNAELCAAHGLEHIRLIAPTTPESRIREITDAGEGFIYYVSREGVTGEQSQLSDTLAERVALIKKHTALPVVVGFGISSPDQAAAVAKLSDGVVVGSAIVKRIADNPGDPDLPGIIHDFAAPMVAAVKSV